MHLDLARGFLSASGRSSGVGGCSQGATGDVCVPWSLSNSLWLPRIAAGSELALEGTPRTVEAAQRAVLDPPDLRGEAIDEVAVVAHEEQRAVVREKDAFKGLARR